MDTKQLTTFVMLAQEKNYARVSEKLNYASSTLIEHVRSLEEELGSRLTCREGKQILLTETGEAFLEYAKKLLALQEEARERVETLQGSEKISIATAESIGQYSLARLFQEYTLRHPECVTSVKVANCATFPAQLIEKKIDFGFLYDLQPARSSALESQALFWEPLCFVVHPEHRLAGKASVHAEDFADERLALTFEDCCYSMAFKEMLARRGVRVRCKNHLGSVNMVKDCIRQNYGVSLLPLAAVEEELENGTFCRLNWAEKPFWVLAQVLYRKNRPLTPPMEELLEMAIRYGEKRTQRLFDQQEALEGSM